MKLVTPFSTKVKDAYIYISPSTLFMAWRLAQGHFYLYLTFILFAQILWQIYDINFSFNFELYIKR
jgi:hypothetical protein